MKVGAVAGFAAPIFALAFILCAIVSYPPFSWTSNALSDLGVVKGVTSILFTIGLIGAGVFALLFAVFGLYNFAGVSRLGKVGSAAFSAATVALVCIGVFNEHFVPTHYLVSVAFFALAPIGLFVLTCAFFRNHQRGLAVFSVAIGVAAALPWILQFAIRYVPNVAIPEAVSAAAVSVWAIVLSAKMLKAAKRVSLVGSCSIF
ncbi:MAG: DUF998 domain-containing protein [Candidatus Bathyarchaeota archaeon]|nr:DUF998 domain-containing protein [Candidatus Bathyarchaeota archaeon]